MVQMVSDCAILHLNFKTFWYSLETLYPIFVITSDDLTLKKP